jgi:hypothetical protein
MSVWTKVGNIMGPEGPPGPATAKLTFVYGEDLTSQIDGSKTTFVTSAAFINNSLEVYLNGLRQRRVDDYNEISTTQFTIVSPPRLTDTISVDYAIPPSTVPVVFGETPAGSIDGVNQIFTTSFVYSPNQLAVFLCGVRLRRVDDYIETSNSTFQLVAPPLSGDSLTVDYMQP